MSITGRGIKKAQAVKRHEMAHELVAKTAVGQAHVVFDAIMTSRGDIYKKLQAKWPDADSAEIERRFVEELAPTLLDEARSTLAGMLASPSIDHLQKEVIYDALRLDNTLKRATGRVGVEVAPKARSPGGERLQ